MHVVQAEISLGSEFRFHMPSALQLQRLILFLFSSHFIFGKNIKFPNKTNAGIENSEEKNEMFYHTTQKNGYNLVNTA